MSLEVKCLDDNCDYLFVKKSDLKKNDHALLYLLNHRSNGPVNAHLISGPSAKTSFSTFDIVLK